MEYKDRKSPKIKYHKVIRSIINDNPEYLIDMLYDQIAQENKSPDYSRHDSLEAMHTADAWIQNNRNAQKGFSMIEMLQNKESFLAGYMCRREIENIEEFSEIFEPRLEV